MDFKMADTSECRVFCNTILLKYHGEDIHLSDFLEKTPKNGDLFFLIEKGGSRTFSLTFFIHPR